MEIVGDRARVAASPAQPTLRLGLGRDGKILSATFDRGCGLFRVRYYGTPAIACTISYSTNDSLGTVPLNKERGLPPIVRPLRSIEGMLCSLSTDNMKVSAYLIMTSFARSYRSTFCTKVNIRAPEVDGRESIDLGTTCTCPTGSHPRSCHLSLRGFTLYLCRPSCLRQPQQ